MHYIRTPSHKENRWRCATVSKHLYLVDNEILQIKLKDGLPDEHFQSVPPYYMKRGICETETVSDVGEWIKIPYTLMSPIARCYYYYVTFK
jgi:hypothetical protein